MRSGSLHCDIWREGDTMNRKMINWLGLTGILSLLSYTAAVVISRNAWDYDPKSCTATGPSPGIVSIRCRVGDEPWTSPAAETISV